MLNGIIGCKVMYFFDYNQCNTFTIHLGICTLQFCLFDAYFCPRTWEQMRSNLGADATAHGARYVRTWAQMQLHMGPDAVVLGVGRS